MDLMAAEVGRLVSCWFIQFSLLVCLANSSQSNYNNKQTELKPALKRNQQAKPISICIQFRFRFILAPNRNETGIETNGLA